MITLHFATKFVYIHLSYIHILAGHLPDDRHRVGTVDSAGGMPKML